MYVNFRVLYFLNLTVVKINAVDIVIFSLTITNHIITSNLLKNKFNIQNDMDICNNILLHMSE